MIFNKLLLGDKMNQLKNLKNLFKALKELLTGKSIISGRYFYDNKYPITKFFSYYKKKINIKCIMSGFPRTGTHWIRNVIEKSTGEKTYNLYKNKPSPNDKIVTVIKIHARSKKIAYLKALWLLPSFNFENKYIYVYRDPRDAIISLYEMYKKEKKANIMDIKKYLNRQDPIGQYRWEINSWVFKKHDNVLLVKFENLKMNPYEGFKRIFEFLNLKSPVLVDSVQQMVATEDGKERPRGIAYGWKKAPKEYKILIDSVSSELKKEIALLGYET